METIKETRARLGLSQAELAERLGLNQSTISRMESGELALDKRTEIALRVVAGNTKRSEK